MHASIRVSIGISKPSLPSALFKHVVRTFLGGDGQLGPNMRCINGFGLLALGGGHHERGEVVHVHF